MKEALQIWVDKRRYEELVRRDQDGYRRHPIGKDEFDLILGARA